VRIKNWFFDWTETIVVAFILALIIRAFFLQVFWIPSSSMEPTLNINERIVVNKVAYHFRQPRRQEMVVFRQVLPLAARSQEKNDLIKRVMGLPGEAFELKSGAVYINGKKIDEHHQLNQDYADFGPVVIPPGNYLVLGDNRPVSADSRFWGFLPQANFIGPAFLRLWPLSKFGLL